MKQLVLLISVYLISFNVSYGQGKLQKAENSLKEKENSGSTTYSNSTNNDDSGGNFFAETIGYLLLDAFLYTTYYAFIESPLEYNTPSTNAYLTKYPYLKSNKGNYSYDWDKTTPIARLKLSSRYVFESNRIKGNHLNFDFRFSKRLAVEANYLQLWENSTNFGYNSLAFYTALLKYHRVRTEKLDVWWGVGASYVDGEVNELGFTYGLGAELFFAKPLSLESNFNQTLINNGTINKFNVLLNYHQKQYKFTGGYEHLKIGSQPFSMLTFGVGIFF